MFLIDNKQIFSYLYDSSFNIIGQKTAQSPPEKFRIFLGSNSTNRKYNLFFTNITRKQFHCVTIDFNIGLVINNKIELKLRNETLLKSLSIGNKFYIISVDNSSFKLKLYEHKDGISFESKTFDFRNYNKKEESQSANSDEYAYIHKIISELKKIREIDNQVPNSIELASSYTKLFWNENELIFTFDSKREYTRVIRINLNNNSMTNKTFDHSEINRKGVLFTRSNSFILDSTLYQVIISANQLNLSMTNIDSGSLIKSYSVLKNEEISFKNSPCIKEGGATIFNVDSKKEIKETYNILRIIANSKVGLAVFEPVNNLELTIGGYKEYNRGGSLTTINMYSVNPSTGNMNQSVIYNYNPVGYSYYKNTQSTYFKCLFQEGTFEHIKGDVEKNGFDIIMELTKKYEDHIESETVFRIGNTFYFGYYMPGLKKYFIKKF